MPTFAHIEEEIANMLSIPDSELDEEQHRVMDEYLNELARQESGKVDSFARFLKLQTAHANACQEEAKRLSKKAEAMEKNLARLKQGYLAIMQKHGVRKIVGNAYSLSVREDAAVNVLSLTELKAARPDLINTVIEEKADKLKIRAELKTGVAIPGAELVRNASLQIR